MSEVDAPQRETDEEYLCCCVLYNAGDYLDPIECMGYASPDAPFCEACDDRHAGDTNVMSGYTEVTAQLRRQE